MSDQATQSGAVLSVLTPVGRGAVAVVSVAGRQAVEIVDLHFHAANDRPLSQQPVGRIVYGRWHGDAGEDLIVCRTSDDALEIHCHGGSQSVATLVADLTSAGCCEVSWQEWLARRADDPLRAAAKVALASSKSLRTARVLLDQARGALTDELRAIGELLNARSPEAAERLEQLTARGPLGLHLTEPWQVVIAGQPNVGKSSLINALVGYQRAIVFDQPGTTRDVVSVETLAEGWPLALSDTAGLHSAGDELERAGMELARGRLRRADLIVWVLDATQIDPGTKSLTALAQEQAVHDAEEFDIPRMLVVANKIDRLTNAERVAFTTESNALHTSATQLIGIDTLLSTVAHRLVPEVPPAGTAVPFLPEQWEQLTRACKEVREHRFAAAREILQGML